MITDAKSFAELVPQFMIAGTPITQELRKLSPMFKASVGFAAPVRHTDAALITFTGCASDRHVWLQASTDATGRNSFEHSSRETVASVDSV